MHSRSHLTSFLLAGLFAGGVSTSAYAQTQTRDSERTTQGQTTQQTQQQREAQQQREQREEQLRQQRQGQERQGQERTDAQRDALGHDRTSDRDQDRSQQDRYGHQSEQSQRQGQHREGLHREGQGVLGWADAEDFQHGNGMSSLERKALFPFWEQQELATQISLTDEQREDLTESYVKTMKEVEEAKSKARVAMIDLNAELQKTEPDTGSVGRHSDAISRANGEKQKAILTHKALVKNTLNEDQQRKLESAGPQYAQRLQSQLDQTRQRIDQAITRGGGIEEVDSILDQSQIPHHMRERMSDDYTNRINRGQYQRQDGQQRDGQQRDGQQRQGQQRDQQDRTGANNASDRQSGTHSTTSTTQSRTQSSSTQRN